ncbi:CHC2 zinc finger domain-containing protein [Chitinophaga sp. GCM10012297]|uniref:Toprim domain-containing protein n=1 Tax=Chitinophaga chungangae TaxID=2821488 RepID=A0ABS3YHI5_9BACT|nr:CHC2 zinc finger domain-containing protein [Chitinophaga chungangae]MBO9154099.1 toprim domain-containing protein [Chitinophaga chungangae]
MEIKELKHRLRLSEVIAHYGLCPDKHGRLLCPFHADKTPSLQLYPKTNTFCCFSTNCNAGTGDVIRFIELMDRCSTHEAIMKAKTLIGVTSAVPAVLPVAASSADPLEREAVLTKVFGSFRKALPASRKATDYLQGRGLDYRQHECGYNSGGLHVESKNHHLVTSMVKHGLLKAKPAGGYSVWAKDCVIFPLKDAAGKIVSLYGRSITNNNDQRHFYMTGRTGLYPCYPAPVTTKLILTESILDAASLLQQPAIAAQYSVLALYGTNGLTEEHQQAIIKLPALCEILFILDGDEAGRAATIKHAQTLSGLLPHVQFTQVVLPDGEDVNSVLQSHDDAQVLVDLVEQRQPIEFFVSIENKQAPVIPIPTTIDDRLHTANPELLVYESALLQVTVLGGVRLTGLDRLRVTLKVEHKQGLFLPVRHSLDLYHHGQVQQLVQLVTETFDMNGQAVVTLVAQLTGALESYRAQRLERLQSKPESKPALTPAQRQAAIQYLQQPNLLRRTSDDIGQSGIVGEEMNRLIAYLVYSSRRQATPLHVMFLGASGSGKTYLQEKVSDLVPAEEKIEITQVTENAFYYFRQDELKHKLLLIEDLDGAESSLYPLRELQSKKRISKTVTIKDTKGNLKTITVVVEGPVSVSGCTTREKLYEDNANRCLLLYVDGSAEQDGRIMAYQTRASAGQIDQGKEQAIKSLLRNVQQVLQPVRVVSPYAQHITLPSEIFKPRRTMTLLLAFIEAVTFYHQYQRVQKKDGSGQPYIETTPEDIRAALHLLKEVLFSKGDELAKATRIFLEQLKALLAAEGKDSFTAREIRQQLRIAPGTLKRYLSELERYGYLKGSGNRYRHYEYTIIRMDEYEALKSSIDSQLQAIVARIEVKPASPVVQ